MLRGMATNIAAIVYACCKYAFWLLAFWSAIEFILDMSKMKPEDVVLSKGGWLIPNAPINDR